MENICRLCLVRSQHLTSVFSFKKDRLLADMIHIICPVKIDASDELPKKICSKCLKVVIDAIELREKSVKSDLKLRSKNLAMENPEIVRINQDVDPFYSTMFLENYDKQKDSDASDNDSEFNESDNSPIIPFNPKIKIKNESMNNDNDSEFTVNVKAARMTAPSSFFCDFCGLLVSTAGVLRRHVMKKHPEHAPKYEDNDDEECDTEEKLEFHSLLFRGTIEKYADNYKIVKLNFRAEGDEPPKKNTKFDKHSSFRNLKSFIMKCYECERKISGFPDTNSHITRHANSCFDYSGSKVSRIHKMRQKKLQKEQKMEIDTKNS